MTQETDSQDPHRNEPRVGVYICHCGGNISDVVDVDAVTKAVESYPGVVLAKNYIFMCSSTGQGLIEDDIKTKGVNRVVVSACAPALHELTFRGALQRAGLNPYLYEHVNIREQDSWVHKQDKKGATEKAIKLTLAAIEKISRQQELTPIRVNSEKSAAVIGAGPAGLNAALALSANGLKVFLVEKDKEPGGNLKTLGRIYTTGREAGELVKELVTKVKADRNIELLTGTVVESVSGYVGQFSLKLKQDGGVERALKTGALIITTGFKAYEPYNGEFSYGTDKRVLTLPEFNEKMKAPGAAEYFRNIKAVSFIHCVGSRQTEGLQKPQADGKVNAYCSRICCTSALHAMQGMLEKYPHIQAYDYYKDIRTYGLKHEEIYEDLSKKGAIFFRYPDDALPEVKAGDDGRLSVKVKDILTWNEEVEASCDLLVLATGVMPNAIPGLVNSLKLPIGSDRFLLEAHPKLRPVEIPNMGIYIAGGAQAPMDVQEAATGAKAASAKASMLLSTEHILLDPFVAKVDPDLCDGCEKCVAECLYAGAIVMKDTPKGRKAEVLEALCKGCGACAAVCPRRAINVSGYSLDQLDAMVEAIAKE